MQKIQVTTGFGYFVDQAGHKIAKAELPPGEHPLQDGFTYVEVADKQALELIELWIDPKMLQQQQDEKLIMQKTREIAIETLKSEGKLPPDFVDGAV